MDESIDFVTRIIPATETMFLVEAAPTTPSNAYVTEDLSKFYVAEDGVTFYTQES